MKIASGKTLIIVGVLTIIMSVFGVQQVSASVLVDDDFASYVDGSNLDGQGGWTDTSSGSNGSCIASSSAVSIGLEGTLGCTNGRSVTGTSTDYYFQYDFYMGSVSANSSVLHAKAANAISHSIVKTSTGIDIVLIDSSVSLNESQSFGSSYLDSWHTFTFVQDGSSVVYYLDGVSIKSYDTNPSVGFNDRFTIVMQRASSGGVKPYAFLDDVLFVRDEPYVPDLSYSRFIELLPSNVGTTSPTTTVGAYLNVNTTQHPDEDDYFIRLSFEPDAWFACTNSGALYDAIATCTGDYAMEAPFYMDIEDEYMSGTFWATTSAHFTTYGKWNAKYEVRKTGGLFGILPSSVLFSSTTQFIVGTTSPMDLVREDMASTSGRYYSENKAEIMGILSSTTAKLKESCAPFTSNFNMGECLTLLVYPGSDAIHDNFYLLVGIPPVSYAYRSLTIFTDTEATSSLPTLEYTFGTTSALAVVGTVSFDPLGAVIQAGNLVDEAKSDQVIQKSVWDIFEPVINLIVYLMLGFLIIRDLTGIHKKDVS